MRSVASASPCFISFTLSATCFALSTSGATTTNIPPLIGDNIRFGLNKDLGFSEADRNENIRRIGEVAKLFADSGSIAITSFISPYKADRATARKLHDEAGIPFIEVYVDIPIEVAEQRDPKGLYKKARAGVIKGFTGIDAPYEAPDAAEITIKNHEVTVEQAVKVIVDYLEEKGLAKLKVKTEA